MSLVQTTPSSTVKHALSGMAIACSLFAASSAHAALNFEFNFSAEPGQLAFTAGQQQSIVTAGNLFSGVFGKYFSNTATLQFNVVSDGVGVASAGQDLVFNPDGSNTEVVRIKVTTGFDANGSSKADGAININLNQNFQFDPNAPVDFANGQIDLFSVIQHEVTHALGFQSFAASGFSSKFDTFLTTNGLVPQPLVLNGMLNSAATQEALINGALFIGPNAVAAYGAGVPIQGMQGARGDDGRLNHLGTDAFSSPTVPQNALMLCCGGASVQFEPRDYNTSEVGILADLGYSLAPVPEPSTYALMVAGLAGVGFAAKRRKTS